MKKAWDDIAKVKASFETISEQAPKHLWNNITGELDAHFLDDKVKESFGEQKFVAPNFDFSSLSGLKDVHTLDKIVGESFEQTKVGAPEELWNDIQNQLAVEKVWERMASNIKVGSNKWQAVAIAAGLTLLISIIPLSLSDEVRNDKFTLQTQNFEEISLASNDLTEKNQLIAGEMSDVPGHSSFLVNANVLPTYTVDEIVQERPGQHEEAEVNEQQPGQVTVDVQEIEQLQTTVISGIDQYPAYPELAVLESPPHPRWQFNVGVIGGVSNTWIVDNETRESFDRETLYDSRFSLGDMYGLTGEAWLNNKHSFTANVILNSTSRSKLGYYDNGSYKIRTTQIDFLKTSVLYGHKFTFHGKQRDHNLIVRGGAFLGLNKGSSVKENDLLVAFNTTYRKFDYGLNLQIGQQYEWSNFVLGYGVNSEVGLRNIFKGNGYTPSELNYTNSLDIGLYLSLGYRF